MEQLEANGGNSPVPAFPHFQTWEYCLPVCQTIVHANLLVYITQTTALTESEWLFPVLSSLGEFKGSHTTGNSRVNNTAVAVVPQVEMMD